MKAPISKSNLKIQDNFSIGYFQAKENFLNVFNDTYADNDKKPSAIDEAITVFVESDKDNFDFSMWED